jgi:hypothetical protein
MKATKFLSVAILAGVMLAGIANATSIGRSGSSGGSHSSSSSSSSHSSSYSAPSRPAPAPSVAPAPAKQGGIGGTTSSVGVRKSEVTNGVKNDIAYSNPNAGKPGSFGAPTTSPQVAPAPAYSSPAPVVVNSGGGFGSSFMGSLTGTMLGNALFGNHSNGTTVINNGAGVPNSGVVTQGSVDQGTGQVIQSAPVAQQSSGFSMGSIILNVILFAILIAVIVGVCLLFYKGFKMLSEYVNKERGVSNQPFSPTQRFWEIQKAFAAGDVAILNSLLGPDIVDEMTNGLQPSTLSLHNVSHEVRLSNKNEFSVWYKFEDSGDEINQVWHYERFGSEWKLNGIENV